MKLKIASTIIGLVLAMSAGYLLNVYFYAESQGYLVFSYPTLVKWDEEEKYWAFCTKIIPYWFGTIENARTHGMYVGGCSSF